MAKALVFLILSTEQIIVDSIKSEKAPLCSCATSLARRKAAKKPLQEVAFLPEHLLVAARRAFCTFLMNKELFLLSQRVLLHKLDASVVLIRLQVIVQRLTTSLMYARKYSF